jgi:hypothetical protein
VVRCDPTFKVEWRQLNYVRTQARKKYSDLREEFEREALNEGLARRAVRLREKMARHALLKKMISARPWAVDMQDAPGRKTGVLVREYKGHSDLPVYKLDAALLKEMRDWEIAIEKGEWTEKREFTGAGGEPLLDPLVAALEKAYGWSIEVGSPERLRLVQRGRASQDWDMTTKSHQSAFAGRRAKSSSMEL